MQKWDVYISLKAKKLPVQSVIIKSIEQNMACVYEARRKILEFSTNSTRQPDSAQVGVANGKVAGDLESSCETGLTGSIASSGAEPSANRMAQIPMSFSEDRIARKAGFTSSGTYTTVGVGSSVTGGGWEGELGESGGESGSGLLPPEITVDKPGEYQCL